MPSPLTVSRSVGGKPPVCKFPHFAPSGERLAFLCAKTSDLKGRKPCRERHAAELSA